ncbi:MAG: helix-turn-helix domain-containing protein [Flavobacteriales bacterium]
MRIGSKLKFIREIKGLSQSEVAERLFISQRAYSDLENNKTKLDLERLEAVAKIFKIKSIDLLNFDEQKVFNNVFNDTSNGYFTDKIVNGNFEHERQSYLKQIKNLEDEVSFLRGLIKKNNP